MTRDIAARCLGVLAPLAAAAAAMAQPPPTTALSDLTFDAGLARAAAEKVVLLASFQTTWDAASLELERSTWRDARVLRAIRGEAIAIRIDADAQDALAQRYAIETLPTIVFLTPDGVATDRIVGFRNGPQFAAEFEAALAGQDAVARARTYLERSAGRDPVGRERLGRALADAGEPAAALQEYLWCFDEGLRRHIPYAATRRLALAVDIARLGRRHPAALDALRQRRDARAAALLAAAPATQPASSVANPSAGASDAATPDPTAAAPAAGDDVSTAYEFAAINEALEERADTLRVYDQLPADSKARAVLYAHVFSLLIEARRYRDVVASGDLRREFAEAARVARLQQTPCCAVHYRGGRFVGETVVERGAKLVEALAGDERLDQARQLAEEVLAFQNTPEHRELIARHLDRAGAAQAAARFRAAAR